MEWDNLSIKNTLLLVAHPDDETIFCGGTILCYPKWKWIVISVTDDGRSEEFKNAMEFFKKLGVNIDLYKTLNQKNVSQGAELSELVKEKETWEKSIKEQNLSPDIVFTHNEVGEYGHAAHKLLSIIADSLFSNIWKFIYPKGKQPYKQRKKEIELNKDILEKKTQIFNDCYKSQQYIWKNLKDLMEHGFKNGPEIFTSD